MRITLANELQKWLATGEVLERDSHGPKVVRLEDGRFLKIFRSRRPLIARLRPEAKRFSRNAECLQALNIATPKIFECAWIQRDKGVSACIYLPLEGTGLDKLFATERKRFNDLLPQFAAYIRKLHQNGIYFRSLHLGNVLLLPDGEFGLIDFLDLKFKRRPLNKNLVRRNFAHLKSYLNRRKIENFPLEELISLYEG